MSNTSINVDRLNQYLLGSFAEARTEARERVKDTRLHKIEGQVLEDQRQHVFNNLKLLVEQDAISRAFPTELGGRDDHGGNIAAFEELVTADPSMQIKAGVQWGLFGAAVLHLGTEEHHRKWIPQIISLELPGAFAMTEAGHGSDVASIGTTATYDEETEEFVIHTPFRAAWKDYLGNAALHGRAATVFAQLITKGVNHGVHCFMVPIRDENGNMLPGVGSEDDGVKGGLNGIDNGMLHFTNVRIPRTNLLNRYGDVAPDGTYSSSIDSPGRRFFTMISTLVQGRVSLDGASIAASKIGLGIAVTYANQRRQFASAGNREQLLLDYGRHQRRLIPLLAKAYAGTFAHDELLLKFDAVFSGREDNDEARQDLETLAAALKPVTTWDAMDTLQECREACGGAGFMAENRMTSLRADLDIYTTFEGDNNVLLQLVGKRLLTEYAGQLKGMEPLGLATFAAKSLAENFYSHSGLRNVVQDALDTGSERRTANSLKDPQVQHELLSSRVKMAVEEIAKALNSVRKSSAEDQADMFNRHQNDLVLASKAHARLLQWEAFTRAIEAFEEKHGESWDGTAQVLTWVRDVFALTVIEEELGWYMMHGLISPHRGRTLTEYLDRLISRLRPHSQDLVDAFGYTQEHYRAPISSGREQERQDEAHAYYEKLRKDPNAPVPEKTLRAKEKSSK